MDWNRTVEARRAPALAALFLALLTELPPGRAGAQDAPVIVSRATAFDPSVQTAGMGGASVSLFWLDEPNDWGNPAALGSVRGIRYVHGETRLSPLVLDYDDLRSDRLLLGAFGIGVSLAGKPIESLGGLRLEYNARTVMNPFTASPVTFTPYEEVRSFSVGVSGLDLLSNVAPIGFRDRVSISAGHTWNDLVADMGPDSVTFEPAVREGESRDWGALVRVVPVDGIVGSVTEPQDATGVRLELAGGYSERNYRDPTSEDEVRVLGQEEVTGASGRMTVAFPTRIARGWFWDFATPTLAFGFAWERTDGEVPDGSTYDVVRSGGEITILDLFSVRHGRVDDESGVEGETWGAGVSLQYRKAVGVRFDWARVPWGEDPEELDRYGISVFFEPLKFDASGGLK